MKKLFSLIILLTFISCNQARVQMDVEKSTTNGDDLAKDTLRTIRLRINDFKSTIFDKGAEYHLSDTCDFLFECDCCSGMFYFDSDSTFLQIETCMSDYTLLKGSFEVKNYFIVLTYKPDVTLKNYNYANEIDTTAVDYFFKDTILDLPEAIYWTMECDDKILLKDQNSNEAALESEMSEIEMNEYLTDLGFKSKTSHSTK